MNEFDINSLMEQLPDPVSVATCPDATFETYKAKDLFDPNWASESLHKLVLVARKSYQRHGYNSIIDEYDEKSAIYLVRASYSLSSSKNKSSYPVEEWLSTRIVPGAGEPRGIEDLDLFIYNGKSITELFQQSLGSDVEDCVDYIVASSRTCGIPPRFVEEQDDSRLPVTTPSRHRYAGLSFALIHDQFFRESVGPKSPLKYLIGTVENKFVEKSLVVEVGRKKIFPIFNPAYMFFGLKHPREIKLDRRTGSYYILRYIYRFPTYFLDMDMLLVVLQKLVDEGRLSHETIQHYLQTSLIFSEIVNWKENKEQLKKIGELLVVRGKIYGSNMTGEELREVLDNEVADGPELKITAMDVWVEGIQSLLGDVKQRNYPFLV